MSNNLRLLKICNTTVTCGHLEKTVSVSHSENSATTIQRAVLKQDLLTAAKELLPDESRLQACLAHYADKTKPVWAQYDTETKRARFTNICRCGYGFLCPNCGPIKGEKTRLLIRGDLMVWGWEGFTACFVVLTLQHFDFEHLSDIDKRIDLAFRKMLDNQTGRKFKARWGLAGFERNPDYTFGEYGHHSHRNLDSVYPLI
jgi:hypothetical protein